MKKYKVILSILLLAGLTSCSHFLDVTPKNVISMEDMTSIKKSLAGFLNKVEDAANYVGEIPASPFVMPEAAFVSYTDEWDLSKMALNEFTEAELKTVNWEKQNTGLWTSYYKIIGFMNLILHESETAQGEEDMRNYVMGEAYTFRAYCFFKLLQYYAPYNNSEWGIPVCLETYEDFENVNLKRITQKEVYAQILDDIHSALTLLEKTSPRTTFNIMYSTDILQRLEAQVYLYKAGSGAAEEKDWENAALAAGKAIVGQTLESNIDRLKEIFNGELPVITNNPESSLRLNTTSSYDYLFNDKYVSNQYYLDNFAEDNDIRKTWFYKGIYTPGEHNLKVNKYNNADKQWWDWPATYYIYFGFRLSEAYLIQAEALAMSDQLPEAKEVLKTFKEARYTGNFTIGNSKEEFLEDVYKERRKEFLAETDIRWIDMKRLGVAVERVIEGVTYKLEKDDWRYTFPIPNSEIEKNPGLKQNPGWILND